MNDANIPDRIVPLTRSGRRLFCQTAIGGMAVASAGTVGYPIVAFLNLPKSMKPRETMELSLDDLPEGGARWGERMGQQIVVIRIGGKIRAFNGACTHLGCIVQWEAATRTFTCPCHGARFNDKGEPVEGPINTPLRRVEFKVKDGVLMIS